MCGHAYDILYQLRAVVNNPLPHPASLAFPAPPPLPPLTPDWEQREPRLWPQAIYRWGWGEKRNCFVYLLSLETTKFIRFQGSLVCRFPKIKNKRRFTSKKQGKKRRLCERIGSLLLFSLLTLGLLKVGKSCHFFPCVYYILILSSVTCSVKRWIF